MLSDLEDDLPTSHAIADGWAEFAERFYRQSAALSTLRLR
jgi:hypothetical protein